MHGAYREAQETGEFAGAFWLCAQCAQALAPLGALRCAGELSTLVSAAYEETVARLSGALQAACADFHADAYAKVGFQVSACVVISLYRVRTCLVMCAMSGQGHEIIHVITQAMQTCNARLCRQAETVFSQDAKSSLSAQH